MPSLDRMLKYGYFPNELPPPFTTETYGAVLTSTKIPKSFNNSKQYMCSKPITHSFLRVGALRRKISIPNPLHYYRLSQEIIKKWDELYGFIRRSEFSLSLPIESKVRAIESIVNISDRPIYKAKVRATFKYMLVSDLARFYPSIYTHSIPWVLHSKLESKKERGWSLWGNKLDALVRNCQDGQTIGIPIGPDTSRIIGELILSEVDVNMQNKGIKNAIRSIDDYEFCFNTYAEAENALSTFQEVLSQMELDINHSKTSIVELPCEIENFWVSKLRTFHFRSKNKTTQRNDLIKYIDVTFTLSKNNPESHVLKYAIPRLNSIEIHKDNWGLFEDFLLHAMVTEPSCIKQVLERILHYNLKEYPIEFDKVEECFNKIISHHVPLGHGSEVAWSIWSLIELNKKIYCENVSIIESMEDSIVALLFLDAKNRNLLNTIPSFENVKNILDNNDFFSEYWLLIYEVVKNNYLISDANHYDENPVLKYLVDNNISFYNPSLKIPIIDRGDDYASELSY